MYCNFIYILINDAEVILLKSNIWHGRKEPIAKSPCVHTVNAILGFQSMAAVLIYVVEDTI